MDDEYTPAMTLPHAKANALVAWTPPPVPTQQAPEMSKTKYRTISSHEDVRQPT